METDQEKEWALFFRGKSAEAISALDPPHGLSEQEQLRFIDLQANAGEKARRAAERELQWKREEEARKIRKDDDNLVDLNLAAARANPFINPDIKLLPPPAEPALPFTIPEGSADVLLEKQIGSCAGLIEHVARYIARNDSAIDACTNFMERIGSMMKSSAEVAKVVGRFRGLEAEETRHRMIVEHAGR
ncbi:MAG: hypothetical protein ACJ8IR_07530 [Alphaproteobacteria bacterium]